MTLGKSSRVKLLAGMAYEVELPCELRGIELGVQSGNFGNGHFAHSASRARVTLEQTHASSRHVDCADEITPVADWPSDRRSIERQCFLDLVDELERVAALAIHLVDECNDRNVAQPADLEQLARARLDALGRIDHHHGRIDRGESPICVFGEVLVAGSIEEIEHAALEPEGKH